MIEPNVGRTDYCVEVCIGNGFYLPWLDFCHVDGRELLRFISANGRISFECDRDRMARLRDLRLRPGDPRAYPTAPCFLTPGTTAQRRSRRGCSDGKGRAYAEV